LKCARSESAEAFLILYVDWNLRRMVVVRL